MCVSVITFSRSKNNIENFQFWAVPCIVNAKGPIEPDFFYKKKTILRDVFRYFTIFAPPFERQV